MTSVTRPSVRRPASALLVLALAAAGLVLAAVPGAAPAAAAPIGVNGSCAQTSRTIPHPTTSTETVSIFEPTGGGPAVDGGRCDDNSRPVVLFAHGYGGRTPAAYAALIQHLTSRGFVVVYPTYPNAGTFATWIPMEDAGFQAGLNVTGRADRSRIGLVSHSNGAGMTPRLAQLAGDHGWGSQSFFVVPIAAFLSALVPLGPIGMPAKVRWLQIAFQQDAVVDNGFGVELFDSLQLPPSRKQHLTVRSDPAHGLVAAHLTPTGLATDDVDVYGVWRPIDVMASCSVSGVDCGYDLGNAQVGSTLHPANIVSGDPVDANPPLPNVISPPSLECTTPINPRPCPVSPWFTPFLDQTVPIGGTTTQQSATFGDHQSSSDVLQVVGTSADAELIPPANVHWTVGPPGQLVVSATGAPGRKGRTTVSVAVTDPDHHTSTQSFAVTIGDGTASPGAYHPVNPTRVLDTRTGQGVLPGRVGEGSVIEVGRGGLPGVPATGVSGVVLNVTAESPSSTGFVTAYRAGDLRPVASNLNTAAGQTRPNLVVAPVGPNGTVSLFNNSGSTNLIADLAGWIDDGRASAPAGSRYVPLSPHRVLDTRDGTGAPLAKLAAGTPLDLALATACASAGGPVTAVALNVTATNADAPADLRAWPTGTAMPTVSNLNFVPGRTLANLVMVRVGTGTGVTFAVNAGHTDVIADIAGCYVSSGTGATGTVAVAGPSRILDTRSSSGPVAGQHSIDVPIAGHGGVPASGVAAVIVNVTGTETTAETHLTVWPTGEGMPEVSNLNLRAGETAPNLAVVKLGAGGKVSVFNNDGGTQVILDVAGWIPA